MSTTREQREEWRREAASQPSAPTESVVGGEVTPMVPKYASRILALLDALEAAEQGQSVEAVDKVTRMLNAAEDRAEHAEAALARVKALCQRWDALTKGESPTTSAIRAALNPRAEGTSGEGSA